MTHLNCYF